ncbi:ABC transporter permease subunit [Kribbella sp. NPDC056861]|uniref:ABC transporter permease n=1 Tax=Kribbella sp. NPDC056861 TaxID=3154857 RepID=UPI0034454E8E
MTSIRRADRRHLAGWILATVLAGLVLAGPWLAPHSPTAPIGTPYAGASSTAWFGTDDLGRDVASRMLAGGRGLLVTSLLAAVLGSVAGAGLGLLAALGGGRRAVDAFIMRPVDAVAAVPPVLLFLLCLTAMRDRVGVVVSIALVGVPLTARIARAAALQVMRRPHVEAATARGEGIGWLLGREVLPLVTGVLLADLGIRFVAAVHLVAAAGFLGIGAGGTDWGSLIVQALPGAPLQPLALLLPVLGVGALALTANLLADRTAHRSRRWFQ